MFVITTIGAAPKAETQATKGPIINQKRIILVKAFGSMAAQAGFLTLRHFTAYLGVLLRIISTAAALWLRTLAERVEQLPGEIARVSWLFVRRKSESFG